MPFMTVSAMLLSQSFRWLSRYHYRLAIIVWGLRLRIAMAPSGITARKISPYRATWNGHIDVPFPRRQKPLKSKGDAMKISRCMMTVLFAGTIAMAATGCVVVDDTYDPPPPHHHHHTPPPPPPPHHHVKPVPPPPHVKPAPPPHHHHAKPKPTHHHGKPVPPPHSHF